MQSRVVYADNVFKKLRNRIKNYLASPHHVRTVSLVVLLIIIIAIPLTVYVVQQQQDIRQRAQVLGGFRSADTNGCGEVIQAPAVGAAGGEITFKAPVRGDTGWQTQKADGGVISEDKIKEKFFGDPRNGGTQEELERNWSTAVGPEHINCNVFINYRSNQDCDVEFVGGSDAPLVGSTANPMGPGATSKLAVTAASGYGSGCRKLFHVKTRVGGGPTATPTGEQPTGTPPVTGTPSPTVSITPTAGPSLSPTNTPTPTLIPSPTKTPTPTLTPTPTIPTTPTEFAISVGLPGIGQNGNAIPNNATRTILFQLFDKSSKKVGSDLLGRVSFDAGSGLFKGTINAGTIVPSGTYAVKVKLDQSLTKILASGSAITAGVTNTIPQTILVTGDVNNDNRIDILDYNILVGCFGGKVNSDSCGGKKVDADLNDDGVVDGIDYNLFVFGLKTAKQGE